MLKNPKGGDNMTRREKMEFLEQQAKQGNEEIIALISYIDQYLPKFRKYPDSARISEIDRYNSLVRSNVHEKRLLDKITIRY